MNVSCALCDVILDVFVWGHFHLGGGTSLESSGGFGISTGRGMHAGDRVYATSVPVGIPLFENTKNSYEPESDEENVSLCIIISKVFFCCMFDKFTEYSVWSLNYIPTNKCFHSIILEKTCILFSTTPDNDNNSGDGLAHKLYSKIMCCKTLCWKGTERRIFNKFCFCFFLNFCQLIFTAIFHFQNS